MKPTKLLLILLLPVILWQGVKGQGYIPLLDTAKQWNILTGNYGWGTNIYRVSDKDTIIGSKTYKIIEEYYFGAPTPNKIFMREDTITGQVFKINYWSTSEESLLYDFSMDVGDSIIFSHQYQGLDNKFFVVSTDSISLLNNEKRRVLQLEWDQNIPLCWGNTEDIWIEGIGSLHGLFYSGCTYSTFYTKLLCYFENTQLVFSSQLGDTICYSSNVSIEETEMVELRIFPNPANKYFIVENYTPYVSTMQIEVFDIFGNLLVQEIHYNKTSRINVQDLKSGVYFVLINTANSKPLFDKLIIIK